jgi:hypothetical protein
MAAGMRQKEVRTMPAYLIANVRFTNQQIEEREQ